MHSHLTNIETTERSTLFVAHQCDPFLLCLAIKTMIQCDKVTSCKVEDKSESMAVFNL